VNNGTPQVNGGSLLEGNSQKLLVQSPSSSYCNPLFTNRPSRKSSCIVDYSLCPTKNLVAYNKPPYEQQNFPLELYSNSSLQAKSLPKSTSKSSKYTYLAPYAHLASMKLSKIKVPTIHHMNLKPHKTHYKNVASKQNASKTCLSYDPLLSCIPSREFAKEVKSVEHMHNGLVTSNPKNLDPRPQFSNERLPKEHALPLFTTSLAIDHPKPINSCPSNQSRSLNETNIEYPLSSIQYEENLTRYIYVPSIVFIRLSCKISIEMN
jgi:hypothetical protein